MQIKKAFNMRIDGFKQIKAFYSWAFNNQDKGVKPQHMSLYMFLVNQNNRNNWVEWFKVPFDLAMAGSCISNKKTYYSCLQDLQEWKLIEYQKGVNNWKAPLVKLEVLLSTSTEPQLIPQSEPQLIPLVQPLHIQALVLASLPLLPPNIKLLTYNLKLVTDNISIVLSFLKSEKNHLLPVPLVEAKNSKNFIAPSIQDFIEYFFTNGFSKELAERAWKGYDASDWKDSTGKQIKNWKQKCQHVWFKEANKETGNQSKFEKLKQAYTESQNPYL